MPRRALALTILLDQFPRNMFRGIIRTVSSDPEAQRIAEWALARGWDLVLPERERMFLDLPSATPRTFNTRTALSN